VNNNTIFNVSGNYKSIGIDVIVSAEITDLKHNGVYSDRAASEVDRALRIVVEYSQDDIVNNEVLNSYRNTVASIGRSKKKFPPSAEALISIIRSTGKFPRISPVVDIYNTVAVQTMLSFGVHDMDKLSGEIQFRFAEEGEEFTPIGGTVRKVSKGDYVYSDQNTILAWMDARDSDLVKVTDRTKNLLLVLQGTSETTIATRIAALNSVCGLIAECCGGNFKIFTSHSGQCRKQVNCQ